MPVFKPFVGLPGYSAEKIAKHRHVGSDGYFDFLPGGVTLDGTKTRDSGNPDYNATTDPYAMFRIRAGTMLGKVTSSGKYANSFLGYTNGALTAAGTTVTLASANHGVEMARRIGATGTFKLIGPPTASGTVRALTATYSAISSTSVTITKLGVDEVQTLNFTNSPAGTFRLGIVDSSGVVQYTQRITYNATIGTLLSNIQAATDAVLATNAIVWGGSVVTAVTATFSGTGYTALPQSLITFDGDALTAGDVDVTRTTAGVDGRFVTQSLIADTDGSDVPVLFAPDGWELLIPEDSSDVYFAQPPINGNVEMSQLLPVWPADASLKQYLRDKLDTFGNFVDTSKY